MTNEYEDGGVSSKQLAALGEKHPTIEAFLKFVTDNEGEPFRSLWNFGGLEFVFDFESHFNKIGVTGHDLSLCMDGDGLAIRKVCRKVLGICSPPWHFRLI